MTRHGCLGKRQGLVNEQARAGGPRSRPSRREAARPVRTRGGLILTTNAVPAPAAATALHPMFAQAIISPSYR